MEQLEDTLRKALKLEPDQAPVQPDQAPADPDRAVPAPANLPPAGWRIFADIPDRFAIEGKKCVMVRRDFITSNKQVI
eukprot:g12813.t1